MRQLGKHVSIGLRVHWKKWFPGKRVEVCSALYTDECQGYAGSGAWAWSFQIAEELEPIADVVGSSSSEEQYMPILSTGTAIDIRKQEVHAWHECNIPVALTSSIVPTRYNQVY
jgi:hypothetical protein